MENNYLEFEGILILPFKRGADGLPHLFGVILDKNNPTSEILLNKEIELDEENSLESAMKELESSVGYKVIDEYLWTYIGEININTPIYGPTYSCYSVDITAVTPFTEYIIKSNIDFRLIELSELIRKKDTCILSVLMKLYINKFNKIFSIN